MKPQLLQTSSSLSIIFCLLTFVSCKKDVVTPTADFSFQEDLNKLGVVGFTNHSMNATSFRWEVDGDFYTSDASPTITFYGNGTHSVSLTATSSTGQTSTIQKNVPVTHGPYLTAIKSLNSGNFFDFVSLTAGAQKTSTMLTINATDEQGNEFVITMPLDVEVGAYPGNPYNADHDKDLSMAYTEGGETYFGDLNYHFRVTITYVDANEIHGTFDDDLLVGATSGGHYSLQQGEFAMNINQ